MNQIEHDEVGDETMRPESINENDLLALIEGRLSDEGARRLRAVLAQDSRLIERVDLMIEDRAQLATLHAGDLESAPGGLVGDAILIAEREGLLVGTPSAPKVRQSHLWAIPRPIAAAIALVVTLGLLGGSAALIVSLRSGDDRLADGGADTMPPYELDVLEETADSVDERDPLARLPGLIAEETNDDWFADRVHDESTADESRAGEGAPESLALDAPREAPVIGPTFLTPASGDLLGTDGVVSMAEAAQLALAGRLELVVPSADPEAWADGAEHEMAVGKIRPRTARPAERRGLDRGSRTLSMEITVPWDPELLALQDQLERLKDRAARRAGMTQASYHPIDGESVSRQEAAGDVEEATLIGVLPSRQVQHVLWWTTTAASWDRYISVRVPMTIIMQAEPDEDGEESAR